MSDVELAGFLDGRVVAPGTILIERRFPFGHIHGSARIDECLLDDLEFFSGGTSGGAPLFMDTETTGLAGGTGTLAFLLGLGRLDEDGLTLYQYLLTGFSGEAAMLAGAADTANGARQLVSFNGKTFDLPLLQTRCRLNAVADPFANFTHVDLLHPVRQGFSDHWQDCRLATVEQRLLGFRRRGDLPGAEVPAVWFDWVRGGKHERLADVLRHNCLDIVSLVALPPVLKRSFDDPARGGASPRGIARHLRQRHGDGRAFDFLRRHRDSLDAAALMELALHARKHGNWELAQEIWGQLADQGNSEAMERLAKYHEHVTRELPIALSFAQRLVRHWPSSPLHRHREARLERKLAREQDSTHRC